MPIDANIRRPRHVIRRDTAAHMNARPARTSVAPTIELGIGATPEASENFAPK
jgi:hypothetical protein